MYVGGRRGEGDSRITGGVTVFGEVADPRTICDARVQRSIFGTLSRVKPSEVFLAKRNYISSHASFDVHPGSSGSNRGKYGLEYRAPCGRACVRVPK
jgi:hypothetical protein